MTNILFYDIIIKDINLLILTMKTLILNIIQLVLAIILIIIILLQQKGAGLSGVFGGSSNVYSTKRGIDKILFYATIIISILFFGISFIRLFW